MTRPSRGTNASAKRPTRRSRATSRRLAPRNAGRIKVAKPESFLLQPWLREAGVYVTPETALQVSAVYGCVRLIVDCLAPAPITVTELKRAGVREVLHDDAVSWMLNYGAPIALAPDAPTSQAIEEALLWAALTGNGNGYAEIQRDMSDRPFALWPLETDRVTPRRDEAGVYYYEISQPWGGLARLEARNMFHLRGPSLQGWVGDGVLYHASKAVGIALASQVYSAAYFSNGTVLSGILTSDKNITIAQARDAKARFLEDHGGGPGKAHGITALGQGVKYQPLGHNSQEAMLVESRRFQVQEIARFFGVPTTLLADNEAWTNLSELYLGFYRNALRPWAERFDAEATRKLFPQRQPWREAQHDLTHLTLGSFKDQVAALVQATGGKPIWTQNEARALFGKNSMEGGDDLKPVKVEAKPADAPPPPVADKPEPDEERPERIGRAAAEVFYAQALDRHQKRVAKGANVAESFAKLQTDCDAALTFLSRAGLRGPNGALSKCADAVLIGQPPETAAALLANGLEST